MTFEELYDALNQTQARLVEARRERDEALAKVATATAKGREMERARVLGIIADAKIPECPACGLDLDSASVIGDIESGANEGAAGKTHG